jgi:hypothetical protein
LTALLTVSLFSTAYGATPKIETKVFVGQLSVEKNKAVLENISEEELAKADPSFHLGKESILKNKQKKKFSANDLSINLNELPADTKKELLDKCNDGQICRITASIKKEKANEQEEPSLWALKIKKIEMVRE